MTWLWLVIATIVLWTIVNLFDKYIISHELRDSVLVTTIFGLTSCLLFVGFALVVGGDFFGNPLVAIVTALGGVGYSIASWCYYRAMKGEEVSRFVPILATEPLIIAVAAYFLFAERLAWTNYLGIIIAVIGAILISHHKSQNKAAERILHLAILGALVFFSARNLIFKYATGEIDFGATLFWFGLGEAILPLIFFFFHHPHLAAKARLGVKHLVGTALINEAATLLFAKAITLGPVSLVTGMLATKPLLVFVMATFMSFFHPKFIRENHSRAVLVKKCLAVVLIMVGGMFIVMK